MSTPSLSNTDSVLLSESERVSVGMEDELYDSSVSGSSLGDV